MTFLNFFWWIMTDPKSAFGQFEPSVRNEKIVLIDRDENQLEKNYLALSQAGFSVCATLDNEAALGWIQKSNADVLICSSGLVQEVLFMMTVQDAFPNLKIMMITSHESEKHQQYAQLMGVSYYLQKRFSSQVLVNAVEQLVQETAPEFCVVPNKIVTHEKRKAG